MPQQTSGAPTATAALGPARRRAAFAGLASAAAGIGAAELVAVAIAPRSSPLFAAGALVVDLAPPWLKEGVIRIVGTADKAVIIGSVALLVAVLAALAGLLERSRPPWGRVLLGAVGALGLVAATTRADASMLSAVPSLVAIGVGVACLAVLTRQSAAAGAEKNPGGVARRTFLVTSGLAAGLGILAAVAGRVTASGIQAVEAARRRFTLPAAAVAAPAVPPGAVLDVPGITPLITANEAFYRIDTALLVPSIDPADWSLTVTGMVEREVTISFKELLALPLEESYTTLACVSNYVGGDLIGNALWLGYPIRHLLARARPRAGADMVLSRSVDGFTAGTPLAALTDDRNAILAVAMNGSPLPAEHGFPVRMVVPGLFGYVSATKWVTELKVSTFARESAYWTQRGWSERGPVKLSSRIDTPRDGRGVQAGRVVVAGVAWAQYIGVSRVEVRIDDGDWVDAELADAISADTWRQWSLPWEAAAGRHTLTVRATDARGRLQISDYADVVPDGATGLHSIVVDVG
ncbi:MAG TPA: molybdopterin-dependent oxidoreductase [Terrimesophilobacter sp.]|uniref:molybdopterin-dependent oxidoreductase n=1 Tax=Terrimesophilobacter sp. TaxID=2906435 RepID=UPI002F94F5EC